MQGHTRGILNANRGRDAAAPVSQLVVAGACRNRTYRALFRAQTVLKVSPLIVEHDTHRHTNTHIDTVPLRNVGSVCHSRHPVSGCLGHTKGIRP